MPALWKFFELFNATTILAYKIKFANSTTVTAAPDYDDIQIDDNREPESSSPKNISGLYLIKTKTILIQPLYRTN